MNSIADYSRIDVSVVLNLHNEAPYLCATLRSLCASAQKAKNAGVFCELIVVFDQSDKLTKDVFDKIHLEGFVKIQSLDVHFGSLGLSRNAGIEQASGEYIWTADGDDLVSQNSIIRLYDIASKQKDTNFIVYPNYWIVFGDNYYIAKYYDGSYYTVADFAFDHPYVSRIFACRSIFSNYPYHDLRLTNGYAYEDWELLTRLRRAGFRFLIASNTAIYYRERSNSLMKKIDSISVKMIPHTSFFEPKWFAEELLREKKEIHNWDNFVKKRRATYNCRVFNEIENNQEMLTDLLEANRIDPEIDITKYFSNNYYTPVPFTVDHWGFMLGNAFRMVGYEKYTDIVLLPWLKQGGGEKYILNILNELAFNDPDRRFLILCGEQSSDHEWRNRLPNRSHLLDVYNAFPNLNDEERDKLVVRLILAVATPTSYLHIKPSIFAHRLIMKYASILLSRFYSIYYRWLDDCIMAYNAKITTDFFLSFIRKYINLFSCVLCDCMYIKKQDEERLAMGTDKYHILYNRIDEPISYKRYSLAHYKLLWCSRICKQKRPEILVPLMNEIIKQNPSIIIDVYGSVSDGYDVATLFSHRNINYLGPFNNFYSLPIEAYDALIYTTLYDGMPNIVLEAMSVGLVVIAPNVGGISEIIDNGITGYLVNDSTIEKEIIHSYSKAINELYANFDNITSISEQARIRVKSQHGEKTFRKNLYDAIKGLTIN